MPEAAQPPVAPREKKRRAAPWLWGGAALTLLLGSALALSLGQDDGRLAPGVQVGGVDVGGLDAAQAQARLAQTLPQAPEVTVRAGGKSWQLSAAELGWSRDPAPALAQAQAYSAGRTWAQRLSELTGKAAPAEFPVEVTVNREAAQAKLAELTAPLAVSPQDGDIKFDVQAYKYVVEGGREGKRADAEAAAKAWAADSSSTVVKVPLEVVSSAHSPARLQQYADEGNALLRPMTVRPQDSEASVKLSRAQVADLFWATKDGLKPDPEALERTFKGVLAQVDRPATPARYVRSGSSWVPQEGKAGYEVSRAEARKIFESDVLNAEKTVSVWPAAVTQPSFTAADLPDPKSLELIATGTSHYYGSSAARRENVRVAASKLDGYVVPKDGDFSFLQAIGNISAANGFVDGLIISGGQTVDGLGGGVCQVSTTAFRGLYQAGLPVVERHQHSYRVGYYEPQTGFEAAVYDPGLDLVMKNDTGAPLLIRTVNDNAASLVKVEVWGKKPKRTVTVSDAVVTAYLPAPATRTVINRNLAPGQVRYGDGSRPGMYLYITRTIKDGSGTHTERLDTRYEPNAGLIERGPA